MKVHAALYAVLLVLAAVIVAPTRGAAPASSSLRDEAQVEAARQVISRVLGSASPAILPAFSLSIGGSVDEGGDAFTLSTSTSNEDASVVRVKIVGTSGVALTSGFYYYLRNHCDGSYSWGLNRTGVVLGAASKQPLPLVPREVHVVATSALRCGCSLKERS